MGDVKAEEMVASGPERNVSNDSDRLNPEEDRLETCEQSPTQPPANQCVHPDVPKFLPWTYEGQIQDEPGKWPRTEQEPLCQHLDHNRVLVRWLIRAGRMLREGSKDQKKLSQPFEVELNGERLHFHLQLM